MSYCIKDIGQEGICRSTLLFPVGLQMFADKQLNKQKCAAHASYLALVSKRGSKGTEMIREREGDR